MDGAGGQTDTIETGTAVRRRSPGSCRSGYGHDGGADGEGGLEQPPPKL